MISLVLADAPSCCKFCLTNDIPLAIFSPPVDIFPMACAGGEGVAVFWENVLAVLPAAEKSVYTRSV